MKLGGRRERKRGTIKWFNMYQGLGGSSSLILLLLSCKVAVLHATRMQLGNYEPRLYIQRPALAVATSSSFCLPLSEPFLALLTRFWDGKPELNTLFQIWPHQCIKIVIIINRDFTFSLLLNTEMTFSLSCSHNPMTFSLVTHLQIAPDQGICEVRNCCLQMHYLTLAYNEPHWQFLAHSPSMGASQTNLLHGVVNKIRSWLKAPWQKGGIQVW